MFQKFGHFCKSVQCTQQMVVVALLVVVITVIAKIVPLSLRNHCRNHSRALKYSSALLKERNVLLFSALSFRKVRIVAFSWRVLNLIGFSMRTFKRINCGRGRKVNCSALVLKCLLIGQIRVHGGERGQ